MPEPEAVPVTAVRQVEIAIVGAGIAGIATAYYLCTRFGRRSVLLIDPRAPMSYTSAQSGDNYRNWWPQPVMTAFTDHSIDLMEELARSTGNVFHMRRRGYLLATRRRDIDELLADLRSGYGGAAERLIRTRAAASKDYLASLKPDWTAAPDGVDILTDRSMIGSAFPALAGDFRNVIHIRRAGDIDSQQLGMHMLQEIRQAGAARMNGRVSAISRHRGFDLEIDSSTGPQRVYADVLIDAGGPFAGRVATMLGTELPLHNVFQQKIAFEDSRAAVPRDLPFTVDLDEIGFDWPEDVAGMLAEDPERAWLTGRLPGGRHCRPEGGAGGNWVKLGWAFNNMSSEPQDDLANEPRLDTQFAEIVLRATARMLPALSPYVDVPPARYSHYGGYYTMTEENWPLIGPLGVDGAFAVAGLSGFGSMAACAAGFTCAAWACGAPLPFYARDLSLQRYADAESLQALRASARKGVL